MNSKTELLTALRINTITQTGLARQSEALESEAKALRAALAVMEAVDNETKQSPEKLSENLTDLCLQCKHCPNVSGKDCGAHDRIKDDDGPYKCKDFVKLTICEYCINANKFSCKLGQPHYTRTTSGIEDCSDLRKVPETLSEAATKEVKTDIDTCDHLIQSQRYDNEGRVKILYCSDCGVTLREEPDEEMLIKKYPQVLKGKNGS